MIGRGASLNAAVAGSLVLCSIGSLDSRDRQASELTVESTTLWSAFQAPGTSKLLAA
jgi:hypothetical protein